VTHGQCDVRLTVTFPVAGHRCPATGTKLYCLVSEAHVCEQLAQGRHLTAKRPLESLLSLEPSSSYTNIGSACLCHRPSVPRKCAPYMGALAAAGCAWSARGDPRYGRKWAWVARRSRSTASSWAQRAVRVDWGLCGLFFARLWIVVIYLLKVFEN